MNRKTKIIIAVSVIVIVATLLGVLYWGLQPVQEENVSFEKLNKKLGDKFCVPAKLPFEGDVECYIIYVRGSMGVVLTRFEINADKSRGYSIKLKDDKREIYIGIDGTALGIGIASGDEISSLPTANYNDLKIDYLFNTDGTEEYNSLMTQFKIDGELYHISAKYDKDVSIEILKSDIEFLLDQMK